MAESERFGAGRRPINRQVLDLAEARSTPISPATSNGNRQREPGGLRGMTGHSAGPVGRMLTVTEAGRTRGCAPRHRPQGDQGRPVVGRRSGVADRLRDRTRRPRGVGTARPTAAERGCHAPLSRHGVAPRAWLVVRGRSRRVPGHHPTGLERVDQQRSAARGAGWRGHTYARSVADRGRGRTGAGGIATPSSGYLSAPATTLRRAREGYSHAAATPNVARDARGVSCSPLA